MTYGEYFIQQYYLFICVGSKYKFRIMAAGASGISEPSQESEEIMIGKIFDCITLSSKS